MSYFKNILWVLFVFLICSTSAYALNVDFHLHAGQSNVNESVDLSLLVTYANSTPVNNTLVNITTNLGLLTPSSNYTNSQGTANFSLNSTIAGKAFINASVNDGYNLTNVTFLPLETTSLMAYSNHSANAAGNITNITFYPVDIFGNINSSESISLNIIVNDRFGSGLQNIDMPVTVGNVKLLEVSKTNSSSAHINVSSDAAVLQLNSTIAGDIYITSTAGSASNSTHIQIVPGTPGLMRVMYDADYTVNTSSNLNIIVYDSYSNPIDNATVLFDVSSPGNTVYNSPQTYNSASISSGTGLTDIYGQYNNVFTTDKRAGSNIVNISVANSSLQHNVTIRGLADNIDRFYLITSPASAIANNIDYYTLSARPVDQFLNPIIPLTSSISEQVQFTTSSRSVLIPLNSMGRANIQLGPTPYVESVSVTATYRNVSGYTGFTNSTNAKFTVDELNSIGVYAVPNAVLDQTQNGNHNSTITVVALDQWGHTLPDIPVLLNNTNTSVGTLSADGFAGINYINTSTNSEGRLYATFRGNNSGNTTIIATADGLIQQTNITVKDEPFLSINITTSPTNITTGSIVNVTTIISVEGELPITRPTASAMLVLDRSGSMDPDYYAGEPLDVVLVMDRSGSMSGTPIADAKTAAKSFVDHLASNAQIGLVSFAGSSSTDLGLTHLNSYSNNTLARTSIDSIQDGGSTAMGEGMGDANDILINNGRLSSKKAMVVLTDGNTNAGEDQQGDNAINDALANEITIYTIGLGNNLDESLLQHIADETGGKYYNAPTSSELKAIYASIAQELSDYDAADVEFGSDGFTPYDYTFNDALEMDQNMDDQVQLQFEGYDFDTYFDAGSEYGGALAGECLVQVNGENFSLVPSATITPSGNGEWVDYELNLNGSLNTGLNNVTFYEYRAYLGLSAYDNAGRDVKIVWNNYTLGSNADYFGLDGNPHIVSWYMTKVGYSSTNTFLINETINDLKVQLDWEDIDNDLNLILTSPSGHIYSITNDSRGYYVEDNNTEYIWVRPVFTTYPEDDVDTVEMGNWTVDVVGFGDGTEDFTITTYIDKKSATQLSSHAFMTSFDEERGDRAGLALYGFEDEELSSTQSSYVLGGSTWVGYFTAQEDGYYTFDVSWADGAEITAELYDGAGVVSSDTGTSVVEVSKTLIAGETYHIDISKATGSLTDTEFTIDVTRTILDNVMAAYFDASGDGSTPKYRLLEEGASWSAEKYANYVGGRPYEVKLEANPLSSEVILCTGDEVLDLKAQVWDGEEWGDIETLSENLESKPYIDSAVDYSTRVFDVKYEQLSGDAIVVYMDTSVSSSVPLYNVWDGSSWSSATAVEGFSPTGNGSMKWIKLTEDPLSDEMAILALTDTGYLYGSVWNGSTWDEFVELSDNVGTDGYQCFDVVYEQDAGRAVSSWYDRSGSVKYRIWNGLGTWLPEKTVHSPTNAIYWIKMAGKPSSNEILLAAQDEYHDVYVTAWNGNSWEAPLQVETNVYEANRRSVDVAYEASSGDGMIVWGENNYISKYRTWDGSSWSLEQSANNLGSGYTRWVQLTPIPETDDIFLMTSDGGHDINVQKWNGSAWEYIFEMEASSLRYFESFDLVIDDKDNTVYNTPVQWNKWEATVASTFENDSLTHLESVIDSISADGLTAIDEGLYVANNELIAADGNSTIVIMSDGLDNAGYHSLLEEAYRARDNYSVIYTVGFGNDESEVDPMLEEIADITGGEYYFAPNSSVLKDIFRGIAADITNFSASGTAMNIDLPRDYVSGSSYAEASYISGSSNSTIGNESYFVVATAPATGNAEPTVTTLSDRTSLQWYLPNMDSGDKWGLWYQLHVDGEGYIPVILPTSSITYTDLESSIVEVEVPEPEGTSVGGMGGADMVIVPLGSLTLNPDDHVINVDSSTDIEITVKDINGSTIGANVYLYTDVGYFNNHSNLINLTVVNSNSVTFSSAVAGKAHITAYAFNYNDPSDVLMARDMITVRPKGLITIS